MDEMNTTAPAKFCPHCGKALPIEAVFCSACGTGLNGAPATPTRDTSPLTTRNYLGIFFLLSIPVVNFILLLVWAFSDNTNINRRNFSRGYMLYFLILLAIEIVLLLILLAVSVAAGVAIGTTATTMYPSLISLFL